MKSQWQEWAREWNLSHRPQRGWMPNEMIAGEHRGFLLRVQCVYTRDNESKLVVLLRFLKTGQGDALAPRFLTDAGLITVPGWKEASGEKGRRIKELTVSDGEITFSRGYTFRRPKAQDVKHWLEALIEALSKVARPYEGRCERCESSSSAQFVLVEDRPMMLCNSCQQQIVQAGKMADMQYDQQDANYLLGTLYGAAGAGLGGVGWAYFTLWSQRIAAVIAMGIAVIAAYAYHFGAKKLDHAGRVIGAILTLGGVLFGEVMLRALMVRREHPELGFDLRYGWRAFVYELQHDSGDILFAGLCALVGIYVAWKTLARPKFTPKMETPHRA